MDDGELGERRIEELVAAMVVVQGIEPMQILFKWSVLEGMVLPERNIYEDYLFQVLDCLPEPRLILDKERGLLSNQTS